MKFQLEWLLRIGASVIIGFLLGYERYSRHKQAGVRTHSIVCLGSCIMMLISIYGFGNHSGLDPSRIASQIVCGVGFLGGGIIFFNKGATHGLTTAAGIWATSAIGMCFGAGMYEIGVISGLLIFLIQRYVHLLCPVVQPANIATIQIELSKDVDINEVNSFLSGLHFGHNENRIVKAETDHYVVQTEIFTRNPVSVTLINEAADKNEHIISAKIV